MNECSLEDWFSCECDHAITSRRWKRSGHGAQSETENRQFVIERRIVSTRACVYILLHISRLNQLRGTWFRSTLCRYFSFCSFSLTFKCFFTAIKIIVCSMFNKMDNHISSSGYRYGAKKKDFLVSVPFHFSWRHVNSYAELEINNAR